MNFLAGIFSKSCNFLAQNFFWRENFKITFFWHEFFKKSSIFWRKIWKSIFLWRENFKITVSWRDFFVYSVFCYASKSGIFSRCAVGKNTTFWRITKYILNRILGSSAKKVSNFCLKSVDFKNLAPKNIWFFLKCAKTLWFLNFCA